MKLVNYALQQQIEYLSEEKSKQHFKEYLQSILEDTSTPYFQRCDYVGLSLNELKSKIDTLTKDISELQEYKKKLSSALDIAKELTAEVFINNGIDRIDGNIISSLTLTKPSITTKNKITILKSNELMRLGYVKFSVDDEAIARVVEENSDALKELESYISIEKIETVNPVKVKVNIKRVVNNITTTDEILQLKAS
ncbi:hypothetical protein [Aliarcobacter butzleri]|uniref:hypothetical protein n=1 Tax=Aliarcobacter butzleri TaxID=28197 RepID=UPI002B254FD9|nr:hypothetical protein [Aliarcobacter butzleri]